jgi:hypothetical protein
MTLETAFRRFTFLPGFIQSGNGEPRKAHWLGNKQSTSPQQNTNQSGGNDQPPQRTDPRGYRQLASITLGEVEEAFNFYRSQLIPSPLEGWVAKNYFCTLPLKTKGESRPPALFGRVKTCYPSDGYIDNIEQMEVYFPRPGAAPDLLQLVQYDLSQQRPAQRYCVGAKMYLSEEEMADFRGAENIFIERGYAPIYENGYLDLLDMREQDRAALPWLHVIGSGWFASIPDSVQGQVREQMRNLVRWNRTILNYHPRRYLLQSLSLNDELDFQYGFTEHYLLTPQDTGQVLKKVEERFDEIFMQGMN